MIICHACVNRDRTPSSYFVVNLACADLVVCLAIYPTWISHFALTIRSTMERIPGYMCQFSYVSGVLSIALSALALLVITYDRYIFISQPLHYFSIMTWKRTFTVLACVWVFTLVAIPPISLSTKIVEKENSICAYVSGGKVLLVIGFVDIPIACTVYFNLKIFKIAREQTRRIARMTNCGQNDDLPWNTSRKRCAKEMRAVKTFSGVTGVLLCCYVPFSTMIILEHFVCNGCVPTKVHFLILELIGINSVVNAYIYGLRHRQYRKGYGRILSVLSTCLFSG